MNKTSDVNLPKLGDQREGARSKIEALGWRKVLPVVRQISAVLKSTADGKRRTPTQAKGLQLNLVRSGRIAR